MAKFGRGEKNPAYSVIGPTFTNYTPQQADFAEIPMAERIARAKKLYAEEGYGPQNPLKITVTYTTNEEVRANVLAIAAMWRAALGVDVKPENQEFQVLLNTLRQKNYEISILGG